MLDPDPIQQQKAKDILFFKNLAKRHGGWVEFNFQDNLMYFHCPENKVEDLAKDVASYMVATGREESSVFLQ